MKEVAMSDKSQVQERWKKKLSRALKNWCEAEGYERPSILADELNIEITAWQRISSSRSIIQDIAVYAKIFLYTDLSEADPQKIPPRIYTMPGKFASEKKLAWSRGEYRKWLRTKVARELLEKKKVRWLTPELQQKLPDTAGSIIGNIIDQLIGLLSDQISFELLASLKKELSISGTKDTVSDLSSRLLAALDPYMNGTSQDRDRLVSEHKEAMANLLIALDVLTQGSKKREQSLKTYKRGGTR